MWDSADQNLENADHADQALFDADQLIFAIYDIVMIVQTKFYKMQTNFGLVQTMQTRI